MATTARSSTAKSKPKTATKTIKKSAKTSTKATTTNAKQAKSSRKSKSTKLNDVVTAEQRQAMIEEAAYFIAEQRNFSPGNTADDWLAAETHIDRLIASN